MKARLPLSCVAAAAVVVGVAACSPNEQASDAPVSSTSAVHSEMDHGPSSEAPANAEHNDADVMFAQMMLPHHEQAIVMSDIMLAKKDIPAKVTALVTQIKDAQGPEITTLKGWLSDWNAPVETEMHHDMEGMLSESDLDDLRAANGTDAARLFLEQMIEHHEGAVDMADDEVTDGKNSDAVAMARSIVTSQQAEIDEMKALLKEL